MSNRNQAATLRMRNHATKNLAKNRWSTDTLSLPVNCLVPAIEFAMPWVPDRRGYFFPQDNFQFSHNCPHFSILFWVDGYRLVGLEN